MILEALYVKIQELEKKGLLPRGEMRPMRKADIAKRILQKAGISEQEAATLVEWILEFLKTTLQKDDPITIHGFGKFTVHSKAPRKGRNPITGETMTISARRVVSFRASARLKTEVNSVQKEQPGRRPISMGFP